jgi:hypothetical protein
LFAPNGSANFSIFPDGHFTISAQQVVSRQPAFSPGTEALVHGPVFGGIAKMSAAHPILPGKPAFPESPVLEKIYAPKN